MDEVKRYDIDYQLQPFQTDDGPYVLHADYAKLKNRLAQADACADTIESKWKPLLFAAERALQEWKLAHLNELPPSLIKALSNYEVLGWAATGGHDLRQIAGE